MNSSSAVAIRSAVLSDLPGVYRVCDWTSDPAFPEGVPGRNPDLLGHVYAGPYVVHSPELAGIVADCEGVAGYIFAVADTRAFAEWCEAEWYPTIREQYPLGSGRESDGWIIERIHTPEEIPDEILVPYPAHLHIDLLPRLQGKGAGRALMEWLFERLRERGVPGVHLGVSSENTNAIAFYEHMGFSTLAAGDRGRLMAISL